MSGRFLVFGDIHGEWEKFRSLLRQVQPDFDTDEVVFLGDYIDRGPDPKKVLDFMMTLPKCETIHLLRGNHEQMMLDAFRDFWNQSPSQWDMQLWLENGGDVTFRQIATSTEKFHRYAEFCKKRSSRFRRRLTGICTGSAMRGSIMTRRGIWRRRRIFSGTAHSRMRCGIIDRSVIGTASISLT